MDGLQTRTLPRKRSSVFRCQDLMPHTLICGILARINASRSSSSACSLTSMLNNSVSPCHLSRSVNPCYKWTTTSRAFHRAAFNHGVAEPTLGLRPPYTYPHRRCVPPTSSRQAPEIGNHGDLLHIRLGHACGADNDGESLKGSAAP